MMRLWLNDCAIISRRGKVASICAITPGKRSANASSVVSNIDWLSGPCSACERKSLATKRSSALPSATTSTSLGPAGMSIATPALFTCIFASITKRLPGPNILLTRGTLSVPNAIAATACAPPLLKMACTPHFHAAYKMAGCTLPSAPAGVHITTLRHPAMRAGMASISTVENSGEWPPGM